MIGKVTLSRIKVLTTVSSLGYISIMDRRGFLRNLIGGIATTAAIRTFPFRVYSFPTEVATFPTILEDVNCPLNTLNLINLEYIVPKLADNIFTPGPLYKYLKRSINDNLPTDRELVHLPYP